MTCNCLENVDKQLTEKCGWCLETAISLDGESFPTIAVYNPNKVRRKRPLVIPAYCPFCGKKFRRLKRKK